MAAMLESRSVQISKRVFTLANVRALATCVERASETAPSEAEASPYAVTFGYSASCDDGSDYQSLSVEIFDDDSVLARKKVQAISMEFDDNRSHSRVHIALWHGREYGDVRVRGPDSNWVNGTMRDIEETIGSAAPQDPFISRHWFLCQMGLGLGVGLAILWVARAAALLAPAPPPSPERWNYSLYLFLSAHPSARFLVLYGISQLAGIPPARLILRYVLRLWPSIELQIGPNHLLVEKRRRAGLTMVIVLAVVPILTAVVYDLLKFAAM